MRGRQACARRPRRGVALVSRTDPLGALEADQEDFLGELVVAGPDELAMALRVSGPHVEALAQAALLHELGRLVLPDGLLGKTGEDAEAYAKEVVRADFEEAGHEDVVRKLTADLGEKVNEQAIRAKLDEMLLVAKEQLARTAD